MNTSTLTVTLTDAIQGTVARVVDTAKQLDPRQLDVPKFDVPKFEMPKFEMPKFEMPKFDVPSFDFSSLEVPATAERAVAMVRDAAYVGVGAVVVTAQEVDQRVRTAGSDATERVTAGVRRLVDAVR